MPFGRKVGPTGRKRDTFHVFGQGKYNRNETGVKAQNYYTQTLSSEKGMGGKRYRKYYYEAYGQEGVREAKQSVHKKHPHKWVKFSVHNDSRVNRKYEKNRQRRSS